MKARNLSFPIVEDQAFQRTMIVRMLMSLNAKVVYEAADRDAELNLLKCVDEPLDIIITDLDMRNMDGMNSCGA
jgi:CheY-like chemotaxis protein